MGVVGAVPDPPGVTLLRRSEDSDAAHDAGDHDGRGHPHCETNPLTMPHRVETLDVGSGGNTVGALNRRRPSRQIWSSSSVSFTALPHGFRSDVR